MKIRKTLIVKTLLMHKICAKYLVVSWKIFQQSLSNFWICCAAACLYLIENYTIALDFRLCHSVIKTFYVHADLDL